MMGLFKKKVQPVSVDLKCPAEGCGIIFDDEIALKRHIDWKHPELADSDEKIAVKAD